MSEEVRLGTVLFSQFSEKQKGKKQTSTLRFRKFPGKTKTCPGVVEAHFAATVRCLYGLPVSDLQDLRFWPVASSDMVPPVR